MKIFKSIAQWFRCPSPLGPSEMNELLVLTRLNGREIDKIQGEVHGLRAEVRDLEEGTRLALKRGEASVARFADAIQSMDRLSDLRGYVLGIETLMRRHVEGCKPQAHDFITAVNKAPAKKKRPHKKPTRG